MSCDMVMLSHALIVISISVAFLLFQLSTVKMMSAQLNWQVERNKETGEKEKSGYISDGIEIGWVTTYKMIHAQGKSAVLIVGYISTYKLGPISQ
jgi:hypothetical protein